MTRSTRAAADTPIFWPPAVVFANRASQRSSWRAWPSVDGLALALGPLWTDRCGRYYSAICARAVMRRLAHGLRCPGRYARPTVTTRRSAGASDHHLNRRTSQKLACQPRLRIRNSDVEAPTADIVDALELRLLDLQHRENIEND